MLPRARSLRLGASRRSQLVAIKVLRSERVQPKDFQTYIKEVQLIQSFNHPQVLRFVGVCCEPPHVCIGAPRSPRAPRALGALLTWQRARAAVTEFLECGSLFHLLHPRPPPGDAAWRPERLGYAPPADVAARHARARRCAAKGADGSSPRP